MVKKYFGAMVIFQRTINRVNEYLVVSNSQTGNVSFVAGAQEGKEQLEDTAIREVEEELGLTIVNYTLKPTEIYHEFVFGPNKPEWAGSPAAYQVFRGQLYDPRQKLTHTQELKSAKWMNRDEVLNSLTFPDLKEVFSRFLQVN